MKKFNLRVYVIFLFAIVISSCTQNEIIEEQSFSKNTCITDSEGYCMDSEEQVSDDSGRIYHAFTSDDFQSLGNLHNEFLDNFQNSTTNYTEEQLHQFFLSNYNHLNFEGDYNLEDLWQYSVYIHNKIEFYDYDLNNWSDNPFSQSENFYIKLIMSKIDLMETEGNHYSWFVDEMDAIRSQLNRDTYLSEIEKEGLNGVIVVSEKSVLYWAPINKGGLGNYDLVHGSVAKGLSWSWKRAAKADGATSAVFMLSSSVGLAAGFVAPPAGLAFLAAWGTSAAIGSAFGGLL